MDRHEIEAAAARHGVRVTGALPSHADGEWEILIERYLVSLDMDTGRAFAYRRVGNGGSLESVMRSGEPHDLDTALAAIARDIDEIAAVRVKPLETRDQWLARCAGDETASVHRRIDDAWLGGRAEGREAERADVLARIGQLLDLAPIVAPDAASAGSAGALLALRDIVRGGEHVGAATAQPAPTPGPCPCGRGYDSDGGGNCPRCASAPTPEPDPVATAQPAMTCDQCGVSDSAVRHDSASGINLHDMCPPDPLALPEGCRWVGHVFGWVVMDERMRHIGSAMRRFDEPATGRLWFAACGGKLLSDHRTEDAARCALAAHLRETRGKS